MNKLNRLTWKYFFEQKWEEIEDYAVGIASFTIIFGIFSQVGWIIYAEENIIAPKVIAIIGLCFLGFWVLLGIIAIVKCFFDWIKDNWKRAKEKAKKKIKEKK